MPKSMMRMLPSLQSMMFCRLEIAMDDPVLVHVIQRLANAAGDLHRVGFGQGVDALHQFAEGLPFKYSMTM